MANLDVVQPTTFLVNISFIDISQISTVPIEANDLVCLTVHEEHDLIGTNRFLSTRIVLNLPLAIGSQYWITLIDRRSAAIVEQIHSFDYEWG